MRNRNIRLFAGTSALAVSLALAASTMAQTAENQSSQQSQTNAYGQSPDTRTGAAAYGATTGMPQYGAPGAGASRLGAKDDGSMVETSAVRIAAARDQASTADRFDDAKVRSQDGRKLGSVRDFLVDPQSGRICYAVVSSGGWAGIGDKLHLVPFDSLQQNGTDKDFTVAVDENTWKSSAGINEEQFEEGHVNVDRELQQEITQSFRAHELPAQGTLLRASKIRGRDIMANGQDIGRIEGVLVQPGQTNTMALIDPDDDFAGTDQKYLVPLQRLDLLHADNGNARASLTRADFKSTAPRWNATTESTSTAQNIANGQNVRSASVADNGNTTDRAQIRVMRAGDLIGTDVLSADGRKVGDIVDYIFDTRATRLAYVLVMTGGFLDIGGDLRAVPAPALSMTGDTAHVQVTREEFFKLPKIDGDRQQFLSQPQNVAAIDQAFHLNAPNRHAQPAELVSFSALKRGDAYSQQNGRVGYIDDVWISLNKDRAPFIEITPTLNPFELPGDTRYAIPMARLQPDRRQDRSFTFAITAAELQSANPVSEAPGVQMVNNGFVGDQVLRVSVAAAGNTRAAGQPTGYSSSSGSSSADAKVAGAAQRVRQALDGDSSLRAANIRVTTNENQVVLEGTVSSDSLRDRAEKSAEGAANGVDVENQLRVGQE